MILYLASDLIWATRIKETAKAVGVEARPVRSVEMLEARLADTEPTALILDLEAPEPALAMLERLGRDDGEQARGIRTICFGPHVAKDLFQSAREAGADDVMARGAFDHHLPELLLNLSGRASRGGRAGGDDGASS